MSMFLCICCQLMSCIWTSEILSSDLAGVTKTRQCVTISSLHFLHRGTWWGSNHSLIQSTSMNKKQISVAATCLNKAVKNNNTNVDVVQRIHNDQVWKIHYIFGTLADWCQEGPCLQAQFAAKNWKNVAVNQRASYAELAASLWLSIRLQVWIHSGI